MEQFLCINTQKQPCTSGKPPPKKQQQQQQPCRSLEALHFHQNATLEHLSHLSPKSRHLWVPERAHTPPMIWHAASSTGRSCSSSSSIAKPCSPSPGSNSTTSYFPVPQTRKQAALCLRPKPMFCSHIHTPWSSGSQCSSDAFSSPPEWDPPPCPASTPPC